MNYEDLAPEEREIINRFRQLSKSKQKAVLNSQASFSSWLKKSARWIWDRLMQYAAVGIISDIFNFLSSTL